MKAPVSSPSNPRRPWVYATLGLIVLAFVGIAAVPLIGAFGNSSAPTTTASTDAPTAAESGDLEDRARGYELVLEREPDNQAALQGLLQIRVEQGRLDEAIPVLEQIADSNPEQLRYRILLAQAQMETGDPEAAEQTFQQALQAEPTSPLAVQALTSLLLSQGREEAAVGEVNKAIAAAEEEGGEPLTQLRILLGQVYAQTGENAAAVGVFDELAAANAEDFRPLFYKAVVLARQGRVEEARDLTAQAQTLAPPQYKDQIQQFSSALDAELSPPPASEAAPDATPEVAPDPEIPTPEEEAAEELPDAPAGESAD